MVPKPSVKAVSIAVGAGELFMYGYSEVLGDAVNGVAVTGAAYAGFRAVKGYMHHRNWIKPLHEALRGVLDLSEDVSARSYIKIPADYPDRENVGRINLPAHYTGAGSANVAGIVKAKLGLSDVSVSFDLRGRKPHLTLAQVKRPPAKAFYADPDIQVLVANAKESAPLLGIGPKYSPVSVDLDSESPHILVSASTGGGKSKLTQAIACQLLHNGGQVVILDFKRHSQKWARGLPGVLYVKDISHIHDVLVKLGAEGHVRNLIADEWEGEEGDEPIGSRMLILLEETNATMGELKRYWTAIRKTKADEGGPADPKESPAIGALRSILFMGRAVKMHALITAQSGTANAIGGPEMRECFATRILARYTVNAWKMLAPQVTPVPRASKHPGRVQVVLGSVAYETQGLMFTTAEAREWATSGVESPPVDLDGGMSRDIPLQNPSSEVSVTRDVTEEPRMSLAEAERRGVIPMTAAAMRQAKTRGGFPEGVDKKYTASELQSWFATYK